MSEFSMNGYRDLEEIAQELKDRGYYWAEDPPSGIIAVIAQALLSRVKSLKQRRDQETELFMGISGIVLCAIDDGIIDEEDWDNAPSS